MKSGLSLLLLASSLCLSLDVSVRVHVWEKSSCSMGQVERWVSYLSAEVQSESSSAQADRKSFYEDFYEKFY